MVYDATVKWGKKISEMIKNSAREINICVVCVCGCVENFFQSLFILVSDVWHA